jgi:hypothetical protein
MMKRLAAQLGPTLLAALFSLMTLAMASDEPAEPEAAVSGTALRWLGFAVRFLVARLFWGS